MGYVSVEVDIDLDEIDNDDLVKECCRRISRIILSDSQKKDLRDALSIMPEDGIKIKTLEDKIKFEHLCKIFNKYTSSQIENLLP